MAKHILQVSNKPCQGVKMRNIAADCLKQTPIEQQQFEIVERKGLGHPDSICDAIMEQISINLSKAYLDKFGSILHHNVDKSLLVAGKVRHAFGGGVVKEPMLLIFYVFLRIHKSKFFSEPLFCRSSGYLLDGYF